MATIWDADEVKSSRASSRENAYTVPAVARPVPSRNRRRLGPGPAIPFGLQIGPALLVLLWVAGSAFGWIDPRILSAPWTVIEAFARLIEQGRLQDNFVTSATRALLGLSIGPVIGTILAVTAGLSRNWRRPRNGASSIWCSWPTARPAGSVPKTRKRFGVPRRVPISNP